MGSKVKIALLVDMRSANAQTITDHIYGYFLNSEFSVSVVMLSMGRLPRKFSPEKYDAIIFHYTLVLCLESYIDAAAKEKLGRYSGLKCAFIQDEYRHINSTIDAINELDVQILFTCVSDREVEKVYPVDKLPKLVKRNVLTGYVPDHLRNKKFAAYKQRKLDISYRSREVPWWLGALGQEKCDIGREVLALSKGFDLVTDISARETDRIYGKAWVKFLRNSRSV